MLGAKSAPLLARPRSARSAGDSCGDQRLLTGIYVDMVFDGHCVASVELAQRHHPDARGADAVDDFLELG